ncbi:MAG TPA: hypothetical protein PLQ13_02125 [Candidatus Krumholzibacteria bacterium]|nr:hypothetical protein [Candidatus Krumholzibacteria bacterium]
MDPTTFDLEEFLFAARYHIIGALMFLVFVGAFAWEALREARDAVRRRRDELGHQGSGLPVRDARPARRIDHGKPIEVLHS